jgi:hypothetical protein
MKIKFVAPAFLVLLVGCSTSTPTPEPPPPAAGPTRSEVVNKMIEAHGGLEGWKTAPTMSFTDSFLPAAAKTPVVSQVTVEMTSRRAYLDFPAMDAQIVWDGEKAWSTNWKGRTPPRFLALLSFYFVGLPWLTADPGANLSEPGTGTLPDDPTEYITVKMTFGPGVGDTPDDYYLLFIDPNTYELKATEFTVTYADVLPPDVEFKKDLGVFEAYEEVEGLKVPARFPLYVDGELQGTYEWREVSFSQPFDGSRMTMPEGAVVDDSNPTRKAKPAN